MIAHLPRRHARSRLFTPSGRGLMIAALALAALLLGLGVLTDRADSAPAPTAPLAWIGG